MAKLYTQIVRDCAGCPRLYGGLWCLELGRHMHPVPQVPPADCPLPDAPLAQDPYLTELKREIYGAEGAE